MNKRNSFLQLGGGARGGSRRAGRDQAGGSDVYSRGN